MTMTQGPFSKQCGRAEGQCRDKAIAVLSLAYIPGMMSVLVGMESGDLIRCDPEMGGIVASRLNLGVGMIKCLLYIQGLWTDDVILAGLWSGETVSVAKVVSVAKSY